MAEKKAPYTPEELQACVMARESKSWGEVICGGGGLMGYMAKKLYNPSVGGYSALGWATEPRPGRTGFRLSVDDIEMRFKRLECLDMVSAGRWMVLMTPVQMDKYGNTNICVIGDFKAPKVALVGPRGLPGNTVNCERHVYYQVREHTKRIFVEKVDFICGVGWVPERKKGLVPVWGTPKLVYSPLAVLGFDPESGLMKIDAVYPGVTAQQVQENTGFELIKPSPVPEVPPPTPEETELIKEWRAASKGG